MQALIALESEDALDYLAPYLAHHDTHLAAFDQIQRRARVSFAKQRLASSDAYTCEACTQFSSCRIVQPSEQVNPSQGCSQSHFHRI